MARSLRRGGVASPITSDPPEGTLPETAPPIQIPGDIAPANVTLDDKYVLDEGKIFTTGTQAIVRIAFDQHRADRRRGLDTATFISGYPGSPLGGLDKELQRQRKLARELQVVFQPGVNEELGATAVWGSQLATQLPGARHDGVLGMWFGKNPGLDRAADAIRHANFCGVARTGGVLALVGDDPSCKSSTLPSAAEPMLASLMLPSLFPGNLQEVLDYGLHGFALSRASGLWVGFKLVTNICDAAGTAEVGPDRVVPVMPEIEWNGRPYEHVPNGVMLAPAALMSERSLLGVRLDLALAYARENKLNRITADAPDAWLGIVAAGKTYYDVRQALGDLGLGDDELRHARVRLLKLGMVWPFEQEIIREFADGLEEVLVVEEKLPFLETAVKDALYGREDAPRVVGKHDERGRSQLPAEGELDADLIARAIADRLGDRVEIECVHARIRQLEHNAGAMLRPLPIHRTPYYCSGCPHNSSTVEMGDALVGVGIGCHIMVLLNPEGKGTITGITQMGGEGAQWIGMAPFTDSPHFFQNVGDGTFHHSASLALRASVAAGVNVTYKLLYNNVVAMTGGQNVAGGMTVAELTRWLELEGVRRIIVTTIDPSRYANEKLSPIAEVRHRDDLHEAQRELSETGGVTVLIHDQWCAVEARRKRRKGELPDPPERVFINERVCEGCGDCGVKSSCLSVAPVDTEFGRKTQIHQPSCNKDYSCIKGDCPSFLTVVPGEKKAQAAVPELPELPEPKRIVDDRDFAVRMIGIGGTGVVTVSQVLAMAAHLEGKHTWGLDQTGLSQKGGPVVSDVRISTAPIEGANKVSGGRVDLYLGFDLLESANPKNLRTADPERTVAVVSTGRVPTGKMVTDVNAPKQFPELSAALDTIGHATRADRNVYLDAQALSHRLFADHMPTNVVALGAAYQAGALPVSLASIEQAIHLNAVGVKTNLQAFTWGRACVAAPDVVARLESPVEAAARAQAPKPPGRAARALIDSVGAEGELRRLLEVRVPELIAYQSRGYAQRYVTFVREVLAAERARTPGSTPVSEAVARQLYYLMAYKDEYEVARLHLLAAERAKLHAEFGEDAQVFFHLHPPLLRALGMRRKLKLGEWFVPALQALRAAKKLRGTPLDVFGRAHVRQVERELIGEYEGLVREALGQLTPELHAQVAELAELPDMIRGYEDIKLHNVQRYRARAADLSSRIVRGEGRPAPQRPVELPIAPVRG
jgi:indolepyruvate ferredoxin oxidoreductase